MSNTKRVPIKFSAKYVAALVGVDPKIARNHIRKINGGTLEEVGLYKNGGQYDFETEEVAQEMARKIKERIFNK